MNENILDIVIHTVKYSSSLFGSVSNTVSSLTPGTDFARQFSWTGIHFKMYLTLWPYSEYLIQMNSSTVRVPDNCIQIFTFLFSIIPISLPSTLAPSEEG